MNRCDAHRESLADIALGMPPDDELNAHLHDCPACAEELARLRALAGRLDGAVAAMVRHEPRIDLASRIVAPLRDIPPPRRRVAGWPRVAVGVVLAASVAGAILVDRPMHPAPAPDATLTLSTWRSPTRALLAPQGEDVLNAPLRDTWFDNRSDTSHSPQQPGERDGS